MLTVGLMMRVESRWGRGRKEEEKRKEPRRAPNISMDEFSYRAPRPQSYFRNELRGYVLRLEYVLLNNIRSTIRSPGK